MAHDFYRFPELRQNQLEIYYFESPHKQIFEDFRAKVIKVVDGDTIRLTCDFRDFDFPFRFFGINAPEMSEAGGKESKEFLEDLILNEEVLIIINPRHRVEKWGRLLGEVMHRGSNIGDVMMTFGMATTFEARHEDKVMDLNFILKEFMI